MIITGHSILLPGHHHSILLPRWQLRHGLPSFHFSVVLADFRFTILTFLIAEAIRRQLRDVEI